LRKLKLEEGQEICVELAEHGQGLTLTKLIVRGKVPIELVAASMENLSKFCRKKNIVLMLHGEAAGRDQ